jgi:hypothetical protein
MRGKLNILIPIIILGLALAPVSCANTPPAPTQSTTPLTTPLTTPPSTPLTTPPAQSTDTPETPSDVKFSFLTIIPLQEVLPITVPDISLIKEMTLKTLSVQAVTYKRDEFPKDSNLPVAEGQLLLRVSGKVENRLERGGYITLLSKGYGASGNFISGALEAASANGVLNVDVPAKGTVDFMFHFKGDVGIVEIELTTGGLFEKQPPK